MPGESDNPDIVTVAVPEDPDNATVFLPSTEPDAAVVPEEPEVDTAKTYVKFPDQPVPADELFHFKVKVTDVIFDAPVCDKANDQTASALVALLLWPTRT